MSVAVKTADPRSVGKITLGLTTFNILCPHWKRRHPAPVKGLKKALAVEEPDELDSARQRQLWTELQTILRWQRSLGADSLIVCFQEFWCGNAEFMELWKELFNKSPLTTDASSASSSALSESSEITSSDTSSKDVWSVMLEELKRTNPRKPDGIATAFFTRSIDPLPTPLTSPTSSSSSVTTTPIADPSQFKFIAYEYIKFRSSNRVALVTIVEWIPPLSSQSESESEKMTIISSKSDESDSTKDDASSKTKQQASPKVRLAVANVHLTYPQGDWDVRIRANDTAQLLYAFGELNPDEAASDKLSGIISMQPNVLSKYLKNDWEVKPDPSLSSLPAGVAAAVAASKSPIIEEKDAEVLMVKMVCGDFNCEYGDENAEQLITEGFCSLVDQCKAEDGGRFVSHVNHDHGEVGCDLVFYKTPSLALTMDDGMKYSVEVSSENVGVYPPHLSVKSFPSLDEWDVSDHRPVVSSFVFNVIRH